MDKGTVNQDFRIEFRFSYDYISLTNVLLIKMAINMERVTEIEAGMDKSTKKPSDMNAPKRALSAYFLWAAKARPAVMKAHPGWTAAQIGAQLGKDWKKR